MATEDLEHEPRVHQRESPCGFSGIEQCLDDISSRVPGLLAASGARYSHRRNDSEPSGSRHFFSPRSAHNARSVTRRSEDPRGHTATQLRRQRMMT
jgi:hypothetical protein